MHKDIVCIYLWASCSFYLSSSPPGTIMCMNYVQNHVWKIMHNFSYDFFPNGKIMCMNLNLILFMHQNMCTFIFNIFLFVQITCEFWYTFVIPSFSLLSKSIQLICLQLVMCIDQPISCDLHRTMCILIFKIATLCVVCKYLYIFMR